MHLSHTRIYDDFYYNDDNPCSSYYFVCFGAARAVQSAVFLLETTRHKRFVSTMRQLLDVLFYTVKNVHGFTMM